VPYLFFGHDFSRSRFNVHFRANNWQVTCLRISVVELRRASGVSPAEAQFFADYILIVSEIGPCEWDFKEGKSGVGITRLLSKRPQTFGLYISILPPLKMKPPHLSYCNEVLVCFPCVQNYSSKLRQPTHILLVEKDKDLESPVW